jgi:cupin fold WbuC family metalloprotein
MIEIKKSIYRTKNSDLSELIGSDITVLKNDSVQNERFRSRVLYHQDEESNPQHMLICFNKDSEVFVSTHNFAESFLILSGIAQYRFYDESGVAKHDIRMSSAELEGTFYTFIGPNKAHRFFPLSDYVVANEVGHSQFSSDNTNYGKNTQYENANEHTASQLAIEPLIKNIKTEFLLEKKTRIRFKSAKGVAEISYQDILSLIEYSGSSITIEPDLTLLGDSCKSAEPIEQLIVVLPGESITLRCNQCRLHALKGEVQIESESKQLISKLDTAQVFTLLLRAPEFTIKNQSNNLSLLHATYS